VSDGNRTRDRLDHNNEGVRVEPMATGTGPAIDQRELDIGLLLDQRVGESEATGP